MALDFDGNHHITRASAVVAAAPLTMAGWFWVDDVVNDHELCSITAAGDDNNTFSLRVAGTVGGDPLRALVSDNSASGSADSTLGVSAGAWFHAIGVFTSTTSRTVYLNGANSATNTTDVTPVVDTTSLGAFDGTSILNRVNGRLAEWAVWDVVLDAAELATLAAGYSPLTVRPASLIVFYPLMRGYSNGTTHFDAWRSSLDLVEAGTGSPAQADHPRIIYPLGA